VESRGNSPATLHERTNQLTRLILAAAIAAAAACTALAPAPATASPSDREPELYTAAVPTGGLDLSTSEGQRLAKRAAAIAASACGGGPTYGSADQAAVTDCRLGFVQAFRAALSERAGGGRSASR
jgi:UrcA family protein